MVYKIRFLIFGIIFFILTLLAIFYKVNVEVNLLNTLLPSEIIKSTDIVPVMKKTSSILKVVFEADDEEDLNKLSSDFVNNTDLNYFELNKPNPVNLLKKYLLKPTNFLSSDTKSLLKQEKYDEVYNKSITNLYNPAEIQVTSIDKDPFLLLDDFLISNSKNIGENKQIDGKYFSFLSLKIKNNESLSPSLNNKKIKELINLKKQLTTKTSKVYLAGTPVHTYYASTRSVFDINLICILSTIMVMFLTFKIFKNLKPLLPVLISIGFGMLAGFVAVKLWFSNFQVITMVFSTTIIGIGIDYSYHYFFTSKKDKTFSKNISLSLLTTIIPFFLLYLTQIELLKQVAIFSIFGLLGIYLVVLFIYPCFEISSPEFTFKPIEKWYKIILIILFIFSFAGLFRLKFNDGLSAFYNPSNVLKQAETLFSTVSGDNSLKTQLIIVRGTNFNDLIKNEESITKQLDENNLKYVSLSKFLPSIETQKENYSLVKKLYSRELKNYKNILNKKQIKELYEEKFMPIEFEINNYPFLKDFMLNDDTSIIAIFDKTKLNINNKNAKIINLNSDIEGYMKKYRNMLIYLFPFAILIIFVILAKLYDYKTSLKILLPSFTGVVSSVLITSLLTGEINLFSIITAFLVIGFTMDYSIFRVSKGQKTESAVFVSCLTTAFSFLLLSLSGFKLLSSMALVLFFGFKI